VVNFGDKLAGCIAIAAARETAAMDKGEFREAPWFLQNRTYVDDATAGADSIERLRTLSGELEAVARRGGFEFKETLISGDKEDLFGPLLISGSVNKSSTGKAWGVIFVCTSTSLAHVEIAETYSTESFLIAVRRFMALHGAPKRFQSDQGTQLVAASKQLAMWDWTAVHEAVEKESAE
jgi:hypothetical protein